MKMLTVSRTEFLLTKITRTSLCALYVWKQNKSHILVDRPCKRDSYLYPTHTKLYIISIDRKQWKGINRTSNYIIWSHLKGSPSFCCKKILLNYGIWCFRSRCEWHPLHQRKTTRSKKRTKGQEKQQTTIRTHKPTNDSTCSSHAAFITTSER